MRSGAARASSIATAAVPVATSSTRLRSGGIRETRNARQRGSWPNERRLRVAVVRRAERCEQLPGIHARDSMLGRMAVSEDVGRIAAAAAGFAGAGGGARRRARRRDARPARLSLRVRVGGTARAWLALDDAAQPVTDARLVREAASLAALCEVAEESAGGGDLPELRARLAEIRETDAPQGIEEAEAAAAALADVIQPEPRVASGAYLDAIGNAARRLEAGARRQRRLSVRGGDAGRGRRRRGARGRHRAELQAAARLTARYPGRMEGGGMGFPFGGDPEEIMRGLREFAEQQAESVQEAQREQFATLTLNTAVELTPRRSQQIQPKGGVDEQAIALRDAMRVLFPEAVALVSAARQGFMQER